MTLTVNCESKDASATRSSIAQDWHVLQSNVQVVDNPSADNGRTFIVYWPSYDCNLSKLAQEYCKKHDQECIAYYFQSSREKSGGFIGPRPYHFFQLSLFHQFQLPTSEDIPFHLRGGFMTPEEATR